MRPAQRVQLAHVYQLTHGTIRLGRVKFHFALKAYGLDDQLRELADGKFFPRAYVDMTVTDLA